jgi:hypothetical protein
MFLLVVWKDPAQSPTRVTKLLTRIKIIHHVGRFLIDETQSWHLVSWNGDVKLCKSKVFLSYRGAKSIWNMKLPTVTN